MLGSEMRKILCSSGAERRTKKKRQAVIFSPFQRAEFPWFYIIARKTDKFIFVSIVTAN